MVYLYPTCSLTDSNQMQSALEQTLSWAGEAYWADNSKWAAAESKVMRVENITFCYLFIQKKTYIRIKKSHEHWKADFENQLKFEEAECCVVFIIVKDKGQLISKYIFSIFNSPQKQRKNQLYY